MDLTQVLSILIWTMFALLAALIMYVDLKSPQRAKRFSQPMIFGPRRYDRPRPIYPNVVYEPVRARFEGALHDPDQYKRMDGDFGIADNKLIFWDEQYVTEIQIPLSSIQAVKVATFLTVYCQTRSKRWEVYRFDCTQGAEIAELLHEKYQIPLVDFPDGGPSKALYLTQDIYGIWHVQHDVLLYLLWDRLLAYWQDFIDLDLIKRLTIVQDGAAEDSHDLALLRLELDEHQIVGFRMPYHEAHNWSNLLTSDLDVPVDEEIGRKKKMMD